MNQYEIIQQLKQENDALKAENKKLSETVEWMHDTIWALLTKKKTLSKV